MAAGLVISAALGASAIRSARGVGDELTMTREGVQTSQLLGYRATQNFEVRSADVGRVTRLAEQATALVNEGLELQNSRQEYLVTRMADLRTPMLAEATKDAGERARSIAESAGGEIGPVRSARMGVFQITARNSTGVSDMGVYDTSSLDKDITAVVRVTFAVR